MRHERLLYPTTPKPKRKRGTDKRTWLERLDPTLVFIPRQNGRPGEIHVPPRECTPRQRRALENWKEALFQLSHAPENERANAEVRYDRAAATAIYTGALTPELVEWAIVKRVLCDTKALRRCRRGLEAGISKPYGRNNVAEAWACIESWRFLSRHDSGDTVLRMALYSIQVRDFDTAKRRLASVEAINPRHPMLADAKAALRAAKRGKLVTGSNQPPEDDKEKKRWWREPLRRHLRRGIAEILETTMMARDARKEFEKLRARLDPSHMHPSALGDFFKVLGVSPVEN